MSNTANISDFISRPKVGRLPFHIVVDNDTKQETEIQSSTNSNYSNLKQIVLGSFLAAFISISIFYGYGTFSDRKNLPLSDADSEQLLSLVSAEKDAENRSGNVYFKNDKEYLVGRIVDLSYTPKSDKSKSSKNLAEIVGKH